MLKKIMLFAVATLLVASCSSDDEVKELPLGDYENGAFILNQGNFGTDNSSISFLSNGVVYNNVFAQVNPTEVLGDTGQDMAFYNDYAFIVVNSSQKIEIVNRFTMKHVASITSGLNNPRFITFSNGKGYVTNWGNGTNTTDDFVAVIDLSSFAVTNTISVAEGPEKIVANNGKLYVAHQGGYGFGNSVSVIDTATNAVSSITVGDLPNALFIANNTLYVLCSGIPSYATIPAESAGSLVKVDLTSNTKTTVAFSNLSHPSNLVHDASSLYYTENLNVYKMNLSATTLPTTPFFSTATQGVTGIYSLTLNNDTFYVGDAVDFNSNGKLYVYNATGGFVTNYTVGISPTGVYFN